ncbi:MAG: response regulator [Thermodesulfobacteriota bacterium]
MRENEKIEAYLSSIRHDLRSEIMIIREGASIILDKLVGSNCDNCFALLRHTLKSTDQLNRLIMERLTSSQLLENISPSQKEGDLERLKEKLLEKEEELKCIKEELRRKEEEQRAKIRELLSREEDLQGAKEELQGYELEFLTYELLGMISHIIRTPLAVIKESLSLVLDEIPGKLNLKQKELLSNGKKSVDTLIQSIEELSRESWEEIIRTARQHFPIHSISSKSPSTPKKRILIVEDQSVISEMLKMRLEAHSYEVIAAGDGEEGLKKAYQDKPDLILLDIMLPRMDGYKICQILKSDPKSQSIPIIILSGRTPQEIEEVGKKVGADVCFSKPFEADALLKKIDELLKKAK